MIMLIKSVEWNISIIITSEVIKKGLVCLHWPHASPLEACCPAQCDDRVVQGSDSKMPNAARELVRPPMMPIIRFLA